MTMTLREEALKLHMDNNGKIAVVSKVPIATRHDLAIAYTPGVAEPCKDIKEDKNLSFEYTCRGNMVAIIISFLTKRSAPSTADRQAIAVPCWSSWNTGISQISFSLSSIS